MTEKQKRFVEEYLIDCNATQAAIRAGYKVDNARQTAAENLAKPYISEAIKKALAEMSSDRIAKAEEVMEYLTSVLRGQSQSTVTVVEAKAAGGSSARNVKKPPDEKERLKAAELLGKRYGLYTEKMDIDGAVNIVISGEESLED